MTDPLPHTPPPRGPIRWAVIGAGGIARRRTIPEGILPASGATLGGVYAPNNGPEVAREFGVPCFESIEALLASDCDAVYIASPTDRHLDQVVAAARAGKHVLCEKPLGLDVPQAQAMVRACRQAGVYLGTGFMMRFHPAHAALRQALQAGRLGQPVFARAQFACWYPPIPGAWRQDPAQGGGGVLMDLACHCIDLLEMLMGPVEALVCSTGRLVHRYASEDTGVVMLRFASGALGVVDTFFNVPDASSPNRLEIYGSGGSALAEGTLGQSDGGHVVLRLADEAAYDAAQHRPAPDEQTPLAYTPRNLYRAQIEDFQQALATGARSPENGEHGLRNQRLLAACYDSARAGTWICLD